MFFNYFKLWQFLHIGGGNIYGFIIYHVALVLYAGYMVQTKDPKKSIKPTKNIEQED